MARLSKHIGPHQERIINRAAKLSQTSARQVMIPIEQVSMLSTAQT
jgi:CBS domain containing-hemolysin-like protein